MSFYKTIRRTPWLWQIIATARYLPGAYWLWRRWFQTSAVHWQRHYEQGGDSGPGSYGESASYKALLVNQTIRDRGIRSIIEWGCGDGNQLAKLEVQQYIGLDISKAAIERCIARHGASKNHTFMWYDPQAFHDPLHALSADCSMSLDVLFHLVEDDVFDRYVHSLFNCTRRFVIIYALDEDVSRSIHVSVRHRSYTNYIATRFSDFHVARHIPRRGMFGDFHLYERLSRPDTVNVSPFTELRT